MQYKADHGEVKPATVYEVDIDLTTTMIFEKGESLVVEISSDDTQGDEGSRHNKRDDR